MAEYPVQVSFAADTSQNRLWGIPLLGVWIRSLLLIPQAIVLGILVFVAYFGVLISWAPVLFNGRMAGWGYALFGGIIRLSTRITAYSMLLDGRYPPFGPGGEHTVSVTFNESEAQSRLWGIPFVGIGVRGLLLIPHFIVLWVLGVVAGFLLLFSWLPVLVNGRQAELVMHLVGGFYRWYARVMAYAFLLTGAYPPFSLA